MFEKQVAAEARGATRAVARPAVRVVVTVIQVIRLLPSKSSADEGTRRLGKRAVRLTVAAFTVQPAPL